MRITPGFKSLGGTAAAVGVGALMAVCGAGPATAEPRSPTNADAAARSDETSPRSQRRAGPAEAKLRDRNEHHSAAGRANSRRPQPPVAKSHDRPAPTPTIVADPPAVPAAATNHPIPATAAPAPRPLPVAGAAVAPQRVAAPARAADALFGPLPGPGPTQPLDSPMNWTVLAAVRRQIGFAAVTANQPPVITGVSLGGPNPSTGTVNGLVNVTDPNADRLRYRAATATKSRVSITQAGVFTYTPSATARHAAAKVGAPDSARTDTVTVTVTDARGASVVRAISVPILAKNTAPVATVSVGAPNSSTGLVTGSVRASDADGDVRTYIATATPAKGALILNDSTGAFTYTPTEAARHKAAALDATAADKADRFTVTVRDGYGGQTPVSVAVAVMPKNSAPVVATAIGTPDPVSGIATGTVTASDADLDTLSYTAGIPSSGAVTVGSNGAFTYTPTAAARTSARNTDTSRTDAFTITVADGHGGRVTVNVTATIAPSNTAPRAGAPSLTVNTSTGVVTGNVNAVDPDGDTVSYLATATSTAKGVVAVTNSGVFTYTPSDSARRNAASPTATVSDRTDTFTVSVTDTYGATSAVPVIVPVTPVSTPVVPPTGHMAIGMNLESVVDWSPAWTFTDAFKASRPWISHSFNPQTWATTWDPAQAPTLDVDANGNIRSLKTWNQNGVQMKQHAGTLMFDALGGDYAAGNYHAEWDGTGVVSFGFDAVVTSAGKTAAGRNFAELAVTPTDSGIYLRIEETSPTDPVRDFNIWMPDYNGQSFVGQRWQPGVVSSPSPFHPLFLSRLAPFGTLRFMGMQETNGSDITSWAQRRDASDIRQGSGAEGTPSEPLANGISLEYMVELANELDADPWFNMPYAADDTFVRNFATYVSRHLEPGRTVYVEWANEVWNFGWGFEASHWVADKAAAAGLDPDYGQWIVAGQEAKRDMDIWSQVFAGQTALNLVRVAAGWAAVEWVTNEIAENMGGSFDAIAIAPYITPTDEQRAVYSGSTTVDRVIADTRANIATSLQWTANHETLAQQWSTRLGRRIELLAYEGGPHLDGRGAAYQNAFYAATNDPRMGGIYREYLRGLDAAGMDLFVDFQFTGQSGATPWGDFAKLHRMDQPLATAYRYGAVVSAADGTLWNTA